MAEPRINGIVETCIYSTDLSRAARFYQSLGLRLIESGEHLCAFSVAEKQLFLIFLRGAMTRPIHIEGGIIPTHDGSGQSHFAFAISKEDCAAWEEHLSAQGISIESRVSWPRGGESLYFRDPDGNLVELACPGIWEVY